MRDSVKQGTSWLLRVEGTEAGPAQRMDESKKRAIEGYLSREKRWWNTKIEIVEGLWKGVNDGKSAKKLGKANSGLEAFKEWTPTQLPAPLKEVWGSSTNDGLC